MGAQAKARPWPGLGRLRTLGPLVLLAGALTSCAPPDSNTVVLYTSQDQVFAEPIVQEFQRQTGVRVRCVYDSEAVKTVGLANRLLAERHRPQCDVFWNNEELRTRQLAARGLFRPTTPWAAFGYRTRRLVINTNHLPLAQAPSRWLDLTNHLWHGRVALAYPLFGTTATHMLALRQRWSASAWETWCRALAANQPFLVDGNSVVVQLVGRGHAWIGLTDSDDIAAGQRAGWPIVALPAAEETLLIPNTVAVLHQAPHPEAAQQLFAYLQSSSVRRRLVELHALEGLDPPDGAALLQPDWTALLQDLEAATRTLESIFLHQ